MAAIAMKTPDECASLEDVRTEIDRIDRAIIAALGRRFEYVRAAAAFKTGATSVRAPERIEAMARRWRVWAEENGLSPDVIERMFRELVAYFTSEELAHWHAIGPHDRTATRSDA